MAAAESAVSRAGDVVTEMAYFAARDVQPAELCRDVVRACDVFVLIAGFRYGSPVADNPERSYAELEHETAQDAGITRLVFVLGERTVGPAGLFCDSTHCGRQKAFRERLSNSGATIAMVHSPDELELALFHALTQSSPANRGATGERVDTIPRGRLSFVGRAAILQRIAASLTDSGQVVAVTGMSGVGKTSTVIEYARRHAAQFDISWWIRAEDPEMVPVGLAALARALDLTTARDSDQVGIARLRGHLSKRDRWLLIFDSVVDGRALMQYLPRGPGQVLITSRDPEWRGLASATIEVPLFDRAESVAVLRTWTEEISESDADVVAEAVGDLPQALDQAGSLLTIGRLSVVDFRRLLGERAMEVYNHDSGGSVTPATATWAVAFDQLAADDPGAMDFLTLLAWCGPEHVPLAMFADHLSHVPELPPQLRALVTDPLALAQRVGLLRRRAMVVGTPHSVLLHRVPASLLQARTRHVSPGNEPWPGVIVRLLRAYLPFDVWDNPDRWEVWRQLIPHVRAATDDARPTDTVPAEVAWLLDRMATYLQTTGNPRAALPLFRRAHEANRGRLSDDHPDTLFCANNLANNLRELGLHQEAFVLNKDTLTRRRQVLGENHPDTFKSAKNLALNLYDLGEHAKASALDADTLARRQRVLEIDHEDTLNSACNLANNLREMGQHDRARALHSDTLLRLRRALGDDHPRTLRCANDLADDLIAAGDYEQACVLQEETLARRRRVLGDDHPQTLTSAHNLAKTLAALSELGRARELLEEALAGCRKVLGEDHPRTVATARQLATVVADSARPTAAEVGASSSEDRGPLDVGQGGDE